LNLKKYYKLSFEEQNEIYKKFWISKLGRYPDKIEKVGKVVSFAEDNSESEKLDKEYKMFIEKFYK